MKQEVQHLKGAGEHDLARSPRMKPFWLANYGVIGEQYTILIIFKIEMALEVLLLMDVGWASIRDNN